MTVTRPSTASTDIDPGHPVRSFSLAMVLVGLLLFTIQATGVIDPRIRAYGGGSGSRQLDQQPGTSREVAVVMLHNTGLLPVRITSIDWPTDNVPDPLVLIGGETLDAFIHPEGEPFSPFTLDPDMRRVVILTGTTNCGGSLARDDLSLEVRTAIGVRHNVTMPNTHSESTCG